MPVNFDLGNRKRELVTVVHACGHVMSIGVHPDTSDEQRAEVAMQQAMQQCAECLRMQRQAETRKARKR